MLPESQTELKIAAQRERERGGGEVFSYLIRRSEFSERQSLPNHVHLFKPEAHEVFNAASHRPLQFARGECT